MPRLSDDPRGVRRKPVWRMRNFGWSLTLAGLCATVAAADPAPPTVDYLRDVRPILQAHCYECHGPETREAGLRLDRKGPALAGGDSGQVIVPGKVEESLLLELVRGEDPDRVMPPTGETLSSEQIDVLVRWIAAGAPWPDGVDGPEERPTHWAYQPLRRFSPPAVGSPLVRSPIDAFVQARLAAEGIAPSPEADRPTLIKRLYYDLLGLPPSPEAVDRFVEDPSPTAYEQLVDELLQSPHFGERWGRHWLDIARYADSDGYEKDRPRDHAWTYRDWVIRAFNEDLPFDRFTIEQLAGDLLPNPTLDQLQATAFNRQTLTNTEGGVDQEEFRCEATFDRVETLGAAWLGLTLGCARCHSHKYDPISQREYYQLFAFFNNGDEATVSMPTSPEAMARYETEYAQWKTRLTELEGALAEQRGRLTPEFESWAAAATEQVQAAQAARHAPLEVLSLETDSGTLLTPQADGSYVASGTRPPKDVYTVTLQLPPAAEEPPPPITGLRLDVLTDETLPRRGPGRADNGNFVLSEITVDVATGEGREAAGGSSRRVRFARARADFSQKGYEVALAIDGAESAVGWAISPQMGQAHWAEFTLAEPLRAGEHPLLLRVRLSQQYERPGQTPHLMGRFRLSAIRGGATGGESLPEDIELLLALPADRRDAKQRDALFEFFARRDAEYARVREAVDAHRKAEPFRPVIPVAVIQERSRDRRITHVFRRGSFLEPLGSVAPGALEILPPLPRPADRELNRLDLAEWLVSPENPLTPRVVVNQMWLHLFGQGLVKTAGDFGVRGEPPSHPELLDWLATEFLRLNWSRKALLRTILLSHTYRQSSGPRPELTEIDPENRLLARQNRLRVEGEIVRDLFLAASGLLDPRIGGPSVFPPLPPGIAELSYANNFRWGESEWNKRPDHPHGIPPQKDLYRRGMYTFFKRTAAHPNLTNFDCPDANTTCIARRTSNTPLQALQTLNNEAFVDASRALAARVLTEVDGDDDARLTRLFRLCLARTPTATELSPLASLLADARHAWAADPTSAAALVGNRCPADVPAVEAAAWVVAARIVLNLDEFVTRE